MECDSQAIVWHRQQNKSNSAVNRAYRKEKQQRYVTQRKTERVRKTNSVAFLCVSLCPLCLCGERFFFGGRSCSLASKSAARNCSSAWAPATAGWPRCGAAAWTGRAGALQARMRADASRKRGAADIPFNIPSLLETVRRTDRFGRQPAS